MWNLIQKNIAIYVNLIRVIDENNITVNNVLALTKTWESSVRVNCRNIMIASMENGAKTVLVVVYVAVLAFIFKSLNDTTKHLALLQKELETERAAVTQLRRHTLASLSDITDKIELLQKDTEHNGDAAQNLEMHLQKKLFSMRGELLQMRKKQMVYFRASVDERASLYDDIRFTNVDLNIGNAFNNETSVFKAPYGGYYVFFAHIIVVPQWECGMFLLVNADDEEGLSLRLDMPLFGPIRHVRGGANMLITHLNQGDTVEIRNDQCEVKYFQYGDDKSDPNMDVFPSDNTFSGFLLNIDD